MRRTDLEHVLRAAQAITQQREFVVVGSSSLLASVPEPPESLRNTRDVDLYPLRAPELADLIDGSIGELSAFEQQYGYYAQGVGPETAILPEGWQVRLVRVENENTQHAIGYCLEPHDLAAAKLVAHREKDLEFVSDMLRHRLIEPAVLSTRIDALPIEGGERQRLKSWLSRPRPPSPGAGQHEQDR